MCRRIAQGVGFTVTLSITLNEPRSRKLLLTFAPVIKLTNGDSFGQPLAESLQVAIDAGAKRILLLMSSVTDIPSVPGELFAKFQTSFYSDPVDAVFKALGGE